MSGHTPGPWAVFEHRDHSGIEIGPLYNEPYFVNGEVVSVTTMRSLKTRHPYQMSPRQKADARLIAAAPDLLAACKVAAQWKHQMSDEVHAMLSAAIAKAEQPQ